MQSANCQTERLVPLTDAQMNLSRDSERHTADTRIIQRLVHSIF
jgi:hypothetical protein